MPIIPRNESIQGNIPTVNTPVPGIESFAGYNNARIAGQIGAVGEAISSAALRRQAVKDYLTDESLKSELAIRLDAAKQEAESTPQRARTGVTPGPDMGETQMATTTMVPRSESLLSDYLKRQDAIVADIRKRGATKNLDVAIERLTRGGMIQVQQRAAALDEEENVALVLERNHVLARRLGTIQPASPVEDYSGVPVYDPDGDRSYAITRAGIARSFDDAVAVGGMKPNVAEKAKISALAKLDHGRAVQTMSANPEKWIASSNAGTNGWSGRLTMEAMEKLDAKAESIIRRGEESKNQRRLEIERETEAGFFERVQPGATNPLTNEDIVKAVSTDRSIGREKGEHWKTVVQNLKIGGWDDVAEVSIPMRLEAGNFNVQESFLSRVDALVRNKQLSLKTGEEIKTTARTIIQKRNDVTQQEDYKIFSATQTAMNTMLTTSPLLGVARIDQESQTLRANAQAALLDNAQKNGWGTSFEWWKKNQERFVGVLADRVDSQVDVLNFGLPKPLPKDPKTRQILPETIDQARSDAFERHKIDPTQALGLKRAGKLPAGLMNELKTLDELEKWTGYQAEYRAKRFTPGAK